MTERTAMLELITRFDGAHHHYAVICAGTRGYVGTRHGAPDRWDWGDTLKSLTLAQQRHERLQRIADEMTPAERALLWSDTSPVAEQLRRMVR